jgi:hypothetical protein
MNDPIARAPEAAMLDLTARALTAVEALIALLGQRGPATEITLATMAALELAAPLGNVRLSAELLAGYGRRRWQEGFRACEQARAAGEEAKAGPRLVSSR